MLIVIDKNSFSLPNSQEKNWNCYFTGFYYWTELFYDYCQGISINILVSEFCLSMNSFMLPPEKFFPVNLFLILTFNRFSFLANRFRRLFSRLLGIIFLWGCFVLAYWTLWRTKARLKLFNDSVESFPNVFVLKANSSACVKMIKFYT